MHRGSVPIAIDLTQVQQQVLDRTQSRLADEATQGDAIGPGQGAATFERLMEAPDAAPGPPADGGVANAALDRARPATPPGEVGNVPPQAVTTGDRILANMSRTPVRTPAETGPRAIDPVGAKPSIDIGSAMDSLELQMQVARVKEATGLAVSVTQKSSQGVDTLLKSQ